MIGSEKIRMALDLSREPAPLRESYGMTIFGQASLAARRSRRLQARPSRGHRGRGRHRAARATVHRQPLGTRAA